MSRAFLFHHEEGFANGRHRSSVDGLQSLKVESLSKDGISNHGGHTCSQVDCHIVELGEVSLGECNEDTVVTGAFDCFHFSFRRSHPIGFERADE